MALQIFTHRFTPAAEIPAGAQAVTWRDSRETGEAEHEHTFHRSVKAAKAQYRKDSANLDFKANGWMAVTDTERQHGIMCW